LRCFPIPFPFRSVVIIFFSILHLVAFCPPETLFWLVIFLPVCRPPPENDPMVSRSVPVDVSLLGMGPYDLPHGSFSFFLKPSLYASFSVRQDLFLRDRSRSGQPTLLLSDSSFARVIFWFGRWGLSLGGFRGISLFALGPRPMLLSRPFYWPRLPPIRIFFPLRLGWRTPILSATAATPALFMARFTRDGRLSPSVFFRRHFVLSFPFAWFSREYALIVRHEFSLLLCDFRSGLPGSVFFFLPSP